MEYIGSKRLLVKYICPIMQQCINDNNLDTYLETFCGGANVIQHIQCKNRIGSDIHKELICLLNYIKDDPQIKIADNGNFPVSRDHYNIVRKAWREGSSQFSDEYKALIGFCASYQGGFFNKGYSQLKGREVSLERLANLKKQASDLKGIEFINQDYQYFRDVKNYLVYCDPPYHDTTKYHIKDFDFNQYLDFVRYISQYNFVFMSEYEMPEDFSCIWEKEKSVCLGGYVHKAKEKLFVIGKSADWIRSRQDPA